MTDKFCVIIFYTVALQKRMWKKNWLIPAGVVCWRDSQCCLMQGIVS